MRETIHTLASQNTRSSLLEPKGLVVAEVLVGSQIYSQNWSPAPPVSALREITLARPVLLRCSQEGLLGHLHAVLGLALPISSLQSLRGVSNPANRFAAHFVRAEELG